MIVSAYDVFRLPHHAIECFYRYFLVHCLRIVQEYIKSLQLVACTGEGNKVWFEGKVCRNVKLMISRQWIFELQTLVGDYLAVHV
jgi:hypothetical protein